MSVHDAENDSWVPRPRNYIPRPRAGTRSQKLEGTTMPFRYRVPSPYIRPPLDSPKFSSSINHTSPSLNVSEIIPRRLYISDLAFAENPVFLSTYRFTHILSTLQEAIFCPPLPKQPVRMQVNLVDLPFSELAAHLPCTTAFIRDALSNPESVVLVHCVEGVSRSVSVVAGYLMAEYGWLPVEAVEFIRSKRMVAKPNFGFLQQLNEYRESLSLSRSYHVVSPSPHYSTPL